MDSNTYSDQPPEPEPAGPPAWPGSPEGVEALAELAELAAVLDKLAARDLDRLPVLVRTQRAQGLRVLADQLEGQWLKELAALDAVGAASADPDQAALSTASWLRARLRMGAGAARSSVRTARALYRGPLKQTAAALTAGEISSAHARVIAEGTHQLPAHVAVGADPVLAEAARRLDPPVLRRLVAQLCQVADPDSADRQADHRHERRGLWLSPTWDGMVAVDGRLEPEAGEVVQAALEPLARPAAAGDDRKGSQRTADALTELCRRALEGGQPPKTGGVRPQLLVTVDLDSLLGRSGGVGGEAGWAGPLAPAACRRLACDAAVTRVLVSRQPGRDPDCDHGLGIGHGPGVGHGPGTDHAPAPDHGAFADHGAAAGCRCSLPGRPGTSPGSDGMGLQGRLRAAMALLPPVLGGAPRQPLEVGRSTRVITPAQRSALAVRDGGCVFPACDRPLAWCDGHHLISWLDGGPTDLANLALLCRAHHRTVHEGGWQLTRGPDGRFTATPAQRRPRAA